MLWGTLQVLSSNTGLDEDELNAASLCVRGQAPNTERARGHRAKTFCKAAIVCRSRAMNLIIDSTLHAHKLPRLCCIIIADKMFLPGSSRNSLSAFDEISIPIRLRNPKVLKKISNCSLEARVQGTYVDPYSIRGESTYEVGGLVYRTRDCLVLSFQPQHEGPHKARIYCDGEDFGPCIQFRVSPDGKAVTEGAAAGGHEAASHLYRTLGERDAVRPSANGAWRVLGCLLGGGAVRECCVFSVCVYFVHEVCARVASMHYHTALPYSTAILHCHTPLPYSTAILHCHIPLPYCTAILHCQCM